MRISVFLVRYSLQASPPVQSFIRLLAETAEVHLYLEGVFEPLPGWFEEMEVKVTRVPAGTTPDAAPSDAAVVFDLEGLILCAKTLPGMRPLYYSLELYLPGEVHCAPEVFVAAKPLLPLLRGLVIQSQERADIFIREFQLDPSLPLCVLPVTFEEYSDRPRSDYLRKRYGIPAENRIALHMGEITSKYNAWNIARAFRNTSGWTLVFHGGVRKEYKQRFLQRLRAHRLDQVIVSEEFCADFSGLQEILLSADVGIVWYSNITQNLATAGWASAKIAAYFGHGVPVIGNHLPSVVEAVRDVECGYTVRNPEEIPACLEKMAPMLPEYRDRVRQRYRAIYRFELYKQTIQDFVANHVLDLDSSSAA